MRNEGCSGCNVRTKYRTYPRPEVVEEGGGCVSNAVAVAAEATACDVSEWPRLPKREEKRRGGRTMVTMQSRVGGGIAR
jgi:hypothetical protein